jgi:hypothetical protein
MCDARQRFSGRDVLIALVEHALQEIEHQRAQAAWVQAP